MKQAIEPAIALVHSCCERVVVRGERFLQIEGRDGGLGSTERRDLRMHGFQLLDVPPDEHDGGAVARTRERNGTADALRGAGDSNDAAVELVGARRERSRIESCSH